jgi:hypothetical protein
MGAASSRFKSTTHNASDAGTVPIEPGSTASLQGNVQHSGIDRERKATSNAAEATAAGAQGMVGQVDESLIAAGMASLSDVGQLTTAGDGPSRSLAGGGRCVPCCARIGCTIFNTHAC